MSLASSSSLAAAPLLSASAQRALSTSAQRTPTARAERTIAFDTVQYPLRELVQSALGVQELEKLHEHEPDEFISLGRRSVDSRGPQRRVELLRHALKERWKGSPQRKEWEREHLPRLVREVIGPASMANEEQLIFQRSPLLRFALCFRHKSEAKRQWMCL